MNIDAAADRYIMSELELKILLAGLGFNNYFGYASDEAQGDEEKATLLNALISLSRENKLWNDGEMFHISHPLESIVSKIGTARNVLLVKPSETSVMCCYCADEVAVCESMPFQNNLMRINVCDSEALLERILDTVNFPEISQMDFQITEDSLWNENKSSLFSAELFFDRQLVEKLEVCYSLKNAIEIVIIRDNEQSACLPYSLELFCSRLLYMISFQGDK